MWKTSPLIPALKAQLASAGLVGIAIYVGAAFFDFRISIAQAMIAQGVIAALLGHWQKLSRWWFAINLLFVPALVGLSTITLPQGARWAYLAGFILLLLLNWNSFGERVPLYLTGSRTLREIEKLLDEAPKSFTFIDLGSGLATTLVQLARKYPTSRFDGVETAPLVFLLSWLRCLFVRNCHIRFQSIWKTDLSDYDVVYCFLSPAPMPEIWKKAKEEIKKGAILVSNTFEIPGAKPTRVIKLRDWRSSKILIWKM